MAKFRPIWSHAMEIHSIKVILHLCGRSTSFAMTCLGLGIMVRVVGFKPRGRRFMSYFYNEQTPTRLSELLKKWNTINRLIAAMHIQLGVYRAGVLCYCNKMWTTFALFNFYILVQHQHCMCMVSIKADFSLLLNHVLHASSDKTLQLWQNLYSVVATTLVDDVVAVVIVAQNHRARQDILHRDNC